MKKKRHKKDFNCFLKAAEWWSNLEAEDAPFYCTCRPSVCPPPPCSKAQLSFKLNWAAGSQTNKQLRTKAACFHCSLTHTARMCLCDYGIRQERKQQVLPEFIYRTGTDSSRPRTSETSEAYSLLAFSLRAGYVRHRGLACSGLSFTGALNHWKIKDKDSEKFSGKKS